MLSWLITEEQEKRRMKEEEFALPMLDVVMLLAHQREEKVREKQEDQEFALWKYNKEDRRSPLRRKLDEKKEGEASVLERTKTYTRRERAWIAEGKEIEKMIKQRWERYWAYEAARKKKLAPPKKKRVSRRRLRDVESDEEDIQVDIVGGSMIEVDKKSWVMPRWTDDDDDE